MQAANSTSAPNVRFATVLVGPNKTRFVVHQELLTYHSEFFRAALTGRFKEAEEKTVVLQKDSPLIFEFALHWMYHEDFPDEDDTDTELLGQWALEDESGAREADNLIRLHVFADKYDITKLKTETLDELFTQSTENFPLLPYSTSVRYAHENLPAGSALLKYLVDLHCSHT